MPPAARPAGRPTLPRLPEDPTRSTALPADATTLAGLDHLLDGALLLGAELDTRYRVLALTVEPPGERVGPLADGRLQVLLSPCAEVAALLLRLDGDEPVVERFDEAQLPDVVAALDGPAIAPPVVVAPPVPRLPRTVSMRGASSALDGRTHRAVLDVSGAGRRLVLTARFDDVDLRDATGAPVEAPTTR